LDSRFASTLGDFQTFTWFLLPEMKKLGKQAVAELQSQSVKSVEFYKMDLVDEQSIIGCKDYLLQKYQGLDILVNNAGIAWKGDAFDETVARGTLGTNYFGTLAVSKHLMPIMRQGGRVVNVSSAVGAFTKLSKDLQAQFIDKDLDIEKLSSLMNKFIADVASNTYSQEGWPRQSYGVSKIGLSRLSELLAQQYSGKLLVNAICPGWVKTDMSGDKAPGTTDEGAETPVMMATLPFESGITGKFYKNKQEVNWKTF